MNTSTKGAVLSALLTISGCAAADTVESAIDKADVAWMLVVRSFPASRSGLLRFITL